MKLIIIEGPGKRDTLKKYLGKDYDVFATKGHVRDLPEKTFGVNLKTMDPSYEIMVGKKDLIKDLKEKAKKAEQVFIATDPDREGEAIAWHIANILKINPNDKSRIIFNEISKNAVTEALKHPRAIDLSLVDAQQTRRILDRIVGYKLSPIICKRIKPRLSAGRVQSVALKLIVDRENEITKFVPEEFWTITAELQKKSPKFDFKAVLNTFKGKKIKVTSAEEAEQIKKVLNESEFLVKTVKRGISKTKAPAPFTTSSMQQDALNKLGMSVKKTSMCAQQLYEGVDIEGEGKVALVTYIRTDSTRVSPEAQKETKDFIFQEYGKEYAPGTPNFFKSKGKIQDAHEAIRPISIKRTPASVMTSLTPDNFRLYKLIYERFLASQMSPAQYNVLTVDIEVKDYVFRASGKTVKFPGFTAVYKNFSEQEEENFKIPMLEEGEIVDLSKVLTEQKFTKPPTRFTEASLVNEMESNGIGRPATYAMVITTLDSRKYMIHEGRYLKPTDLGMAVNEYLSKNFNQVINVKFTADLESKLDEIAEGDKDWKGIALNFWESFSKLLTSAYSNYERIKIEPEKTDIVCDKCGEIMVVREGRYGKFLGCSTYPKCNNIMKIEKPGDSERKKYVSKPLGPCPECGKDVVAKRSKAGKLYYGCIAFPECKYYAWVNPFKTESKTTSKEEK